MTVIRPSFDGLNGHSIDFTRSSFLSAKERNPMSDLVQLTKDNDIAIVMINNPPVNALSPGVPEGISEAIEQIDKDPTVKAAVLMGAGKTFVAGADIKEFGKMTSGKTRGGIPFLPLLMRIEDCSKPVVMAIHGQAFGGGLELAMAGHYRVAAPSALVLGIVDKLIESDLLTGAVAFAREIAGKPARKTRERNQKLGDDAGNAAAFAAARDAARKKARGLMAPMSAIDAVEAATKLPFDQGVESERKLFMECLFSDQSKAMIHVFFGEREVAKIPDVPKETPTIPVNTAAVIGAGTMGGGIAMVFANAGIPVLLREAEQAALDRGMNTIRKEYEASVKKGRFTQQQMDERLKLIRPTLTYDGFEQVDMVIEAVFEGMALKKQVFGELDKICKQGAILASNTSTLNIDEIASATTRPESVIGTHFFSPANVMRLLEIVRGKATSKEVIATCMQLSKKLGKVGVLVGNCRGFVGNRMFGPYRREAQFLVEEGAGIEAVDKAMYEYGMAMGPLAVGDLAGLDVGWRIRKEFKHLEKPGIRQPLAEDRLCEMGRYGQKTGAGWYKYDENRRAIFDPTVEENVRKWAAESGVKQHAISKEEIVDRLIYALVNEGARILEEGYALRAVDIDIIYLTGYGFPAHRGGPMWYADTVGLKKVYDRICEFHRQHGELWEPAPLLKRLAEEGKGFADFNTKTSAAA